MRIRAIAAISHSGEGAFPMSDLPNNGILKRIRMSNDRPTIGFITSGIGNPVSINLWLGVVDAAWQQNVNLLCFVGEALQSPHGFKALANVLYDLVSPENVDGLLFWNSALNNYVKGDAFKRFREQFQPLPMVDVEESPEVLTDSYSYRGMCVAINHLIEVHEHRRIAFIRGPEGNSEAEYRYQAYLDVLRDHQIPFDPNLVTPPGRWGSDWAHEAIHLLYDLRRASFDGLAAPSDLLAVSAMEAIQAKGRHVPKEVAVVGIDDTIEGRCATPPLTTAPYSLYTIGQQGVRKLIALINGQERVEAGELPTGLVIRQSCGCLAPSVAQAAAGMMAVASESFATALATQRADILSEMAQMFPGLPAATGWSAQILDTFVAEINGLTVGGFLSALDDVLRRGYWRTLSLPPGKTSCPSCVAACCHIWLIERSYYRPRTCGNKRAS
jgi:DNA-binding LacI/PurR family transcriptional regulator